MIIAARNEGHNLPHCLDSVREVGEVYVVDSQSTDNTVEIAESFGAKLVLRRRSLNGGRRLYRGRSGLCLRTHARRNEAPETHR
jgi:glycosyltransferase involved in cell wall biosynthesis